MSGKVPASKSKNDDCCFAVTQSPKVMKLQAESKSGTATFLERQSFAAAAAAIESIGALAPAS